MADELFDKSPIHSLVHLYEDGAFPRRELVRRVARITGSISAAVAALAPMGVASAQVSAGCLDSVRVPADAADLLTQDVTYAGDAGPIYGYLARQRADADRPKPTVLVIHENRGLTDHIKDVTRRVARAGFQALGVDLMSRIGGTAAFPDPVDAANAYRRLTADGMLADMQSSLVFLRNAPYVLGDRMGAVGFCAGGTNVYNLAVATPELRAAVPFYGQTPADADVARIRAATLGIFAELDRNFTGRAPAFISAMSAQQKTYGIRIYQGAAHAFHNDTGTAYNAEAACDAWNQTLTFFYKFLGTASS